MLGFLHQEAAGVCPSVLFRIMNSQMKTTIKWPWLSILICARSCWRWPLSGVPLRPQLRLLPFDGWAAPSRFGLQIQSIHPLSELLILFTRCRSRSLRTHTGPGTPRLNDSNTHVFKHRCRKENNSVSHVMLSDRLSWIEVIMTSSMLHTEYVGIKEKTRWPYDDMSMMSKLELQLVILIHLSIIYWVELLN